MNEVLEIERAGIVLEDAVYNRTLTILAAVTVFAGIMAFVTA